MIGAAAALAAVGLLLFRLRTVFVAVRRAAAGSGACPAGRGVLGPALAVTLEPPMYPVRYAPMPRGAPDGGSGRAGAGQQGPGRGPVEHAEHRRGADLNFAFGALLARTVFGPSAWGLYAVSQIVLTVLLSANELGVSLAIIRWDGDIRRFARTVFTLSVASSTLIYVALYAAAPEVARLLGSPDATGMLRLLCIVRDHRRVRRRPARPDHPGVRPGTAHADRHDQLRGQPRASRSGSPSPATASSASPGDRWRAARPPSSSPP